MKMHNLLDRRQLLLAGSSTVAWNSLSALANAEPRRRGLDLPFQPMRSSLYRPEELLKGFAEQNPQSYVDCTDFQVFKYFVENGRHFPREYHASMMQALHDHSITQCLLDMQEARKCVAIMGGHRVARDSVLYRKTAELTRLLCRAGFWLASGGGPGAMEAANLGALLSRSGDEKLDEALRHLAPQPALPDTSKIVSKTGEITPTLVRQAHAWALPAVRVFQSVPVATRGESLAVPTWAYGHEPFTPFASHIAKYFQNSIREEGLLAVANFGIVYVPGSAGTIQEIFQDAAQNYYRTYEWFSPMVLFDVEYWTKTLPVAAVLRSLFRKEDYDKYVLVTDSQRDVLAFLNDFKPRQANPASK